MKKFSILISIMLVLSLMLAGCTETKNPRQVVLSYLQCVQHNDCDGAALFTQDNIVIAHDGYKSIEGITKAIFPDILFQYPTTFSSDSSEAIVKVRMITPDMQKIASTAAEDFAVMEVAADNRYFDYEKLLTQSILDKLEISKRHAKEQIPYTVSVVDVHLEKIKSQWKISSVNTDFYNALSGKLLTTYQNLTIMP